MTATTKSADTCPHCGDKRDSEKFYKYECGTLDKYPEDTTRTELCHQTEVSNLWRKRAEKAEAEVERLNQHIKTQNLIAREEAKILQRWKEWGMTHEEKGKQLEANLRRAIEIAEIYSVHLIYPSLEQEISTLKATISEPNSLQSKPLTT